MEKVLNISSSLSKALLLLSISFWSILSASERIDQSALTYENNLYTLYEVKPYLIVQQLLEGKDPVVFDSESYKKAIDSMLQNFVIRDYLNKVSVTDSDRQLKQDAEFQKIINAKVLSLLKTEGLSEDSLKQAFIHEYNKERFIRESIAFKSTVSDQDVLSYYESNKADFLNQEKPVALDKIRKALVNSQLIQKYKQWLSKQISRKKIHMFSLND